MAGSLAGSTLPEDVELGGDSLCEAEVALLERFSGWSWKLSSSWLYLLSRLQSS